MNLHTGKMMRVGFFTPPPDSEYRAGWYVPEQAIDVLIFAIRRGCKAIEIDMMETK